MDLLWSPWRLQYVSSSKHEGCVFCEAPKHEDRNGQILFRGKVSYIIMNAFPYNTGHVMVVPFRHVPSLELLTEEEAIEVHRNVARSLRAIRKVYKPDGFNVGVNIGSAAGAGVAGHVHVHIVPRWVGDSNFMAILSNTKVLPEMLNDTYSRLRPALEADEEALDH
ncbi:HIT family hydrolase [Sulfodiicoccus acidiphilus]|uniref:HIT family hydrolase n=1 Tax=Sulfodiicoccus acidiphilus TaxID=1670455 RepID=A0A348B0H9_9CREN|nr:HIT domain-containing protein [Sulfodiicoccus acidiphilus]BBD71681.1 HIT family hydrolase [Sulfodiicoccus acidiphilus]GGT86641.1 HIT family hydrolase [Sulfodiicoccus acidiphilus]